MRPTHARGKQSGRSLVEAKADCVTERDIQSTVANPGLMKGGFSGDATILAVVVLTTENGAVAREARHLGGFGACPPRKILDFWCNLDVI